MRAVLHGAMAIYLIRYLNVPPNTIPRHGKRASPSGSDTRNSRRSCASQLKHNGAADAVLKSWMQGWCVTCRACSTLLARGRQLHADVHETPPDVVTVAIVDRAITQQPLS